MRVTYSGVVSSIYQCDDCGKEYEGKNALGLAAKHSDRYGHTVHVQIVTSVTYTPKDSAYCKFMDTKNKVAA